jgi:hypothetical protein
MADVVIPPVEAQPDLSSAPEPSTLKGQAVELWRDGKRFFVVTDDVDAQEATRRFGARCGEIWTSGELELVARFDDQATRDAVEALKRELDGSLSQHDGSRGVSPEESKARQLNELFQEHGLTGQPGRIKPETITAGLDREMRWREKAR